jgi:hypothetical protein
MFSDTASFTIRQSLSTQDSRRFLDDEYIFDEIVLRRFNHVMPLPASAKNPSTSFLHQTNNA